MAIIDVSLGRWIGRMLIDKHQWGRKKGTIAYPFLVRYIHNINWQWKLSPDTESPHQQFWHLALSRSRGTCLRIVCWCAVIALNAGSSSEIFLWLVTQTISYPGPPGWILDAIFVRARKKGRIKPRWDAIRKALKPHGIGVATEEHAHNRMVVKQLLQADANDVVQIDSAGVREVLSSIYLTLTWFNGFNGYQGADLVEWKDKEIDIPILYIYQSTRRRNSAID